MASDLIHAKNCNSRACQDVEHISAAIRNPTSAEQQRNPPQHESQKRKRGTGPEELCPYCSHQYTVRDGLSNKADSSGKRSVIYCHCPNKDVGLSVQMRLSLFLVGTSDIWV